MKINLLAVSSCLCLSLAASGVFAQANNFKGPFGGVLVNSIGSSTDINASGQTFSTGAQTIVPTIEAGYNFAPTDKVVLGATATYDLLKTSGGSIATSSLESGNHYSLNFKPGYAFSDSTLVYATLGYNHRNASVTNAGNFPGLSYVGIGYGVGSMLMLNENVYFRLELQKINYGSQNIQGNGSAQPTVTVGTIGLGYKF
jgi:opacity protein-like surface antigen